MLKRFGMIAVTMGMLLSGFSSPAVAAAVNASAQLVAAPQTYTVTIGWDDVSRGVMVNAFFPAALKIHTGDTVKWVVKTHEIHTVTFLAPGKTINDYPIIIPAPANPVGPLMFNPDVAFMAPPSGSLFDGTTYANSGILSTDPGNPTEYSLTFTKPGTFDYVCVVHGVSMSGKVTVVAPSVKILSPALVNLVAKFEINRYKAQVGRVIEEAHRMIKSPVKNPDGTKTYTVYMGYSKGVIDLASFFPSKLVVHPGDTVNWVLSPSNMAPHTVSFLNGTPDQELVTPYFPGGNPPPLLIINPAVLFPVNAASLLLPTAGYINSGLMDPMQGPFSFSLKIGNFTGEVPYLCLLHDTSGMVGKLMVENK